MISSDQRSTKQCATEPARRSRVVVAFVLLAAFCGLSIPAGAQETPGLSETREKLTVLVIRLSDAETTLGEIESQIAKTQAELAELEADSQNLRHQASEAVIADFVQSSSGVDPFSSDDILLALRVETLSNLSAEGDADALESYRSVVEDASIIEVRLQAAQEHQEEVLEELASTTDEIGSELVRLEEIEAKRLEEERRKEEERRQAEARRKAEERRKAAEAAAAAGSTNSGGTSSGDTGSGDTAPTSTAPTAASPGSGLLTYCPVAGAVSFIDSWGYARSGGRRHKGVDMMASIGTPVAAPVAGTVTLRSNRLGGRSFHLQGDDGNYYYGTHMSAYGESGRVAAGTIIGYVGDDGNAAGIPHLHFEIHPGGGAAVNPYPATRAAC